MSQEEMRRTNQEVYYAQQSLKEACDEFEEVIKTLKQLEEYPISTVGEASQEEYEELQQAAERLPEAMKELREKDREYVQAQEEASKAYRKHNGL